jgi:hypothetical protein
MAALGMVLLALGWRAAAMVSAAIAAVGFPAGLDYGEGIVIQQALLMGTPDAYGDITRAPFIVFHYPPVYHLLVRAVVALGLPGMDVVAAGRGVSVAATVVIACCVGMLAYRALGSETSDVARFGGALGAAFLVFVPIHVVAWMALARVDMVALALSFAGLLVASGGRPSAPRVAVMALLFVLAMFTKQTSIAAPLAAVLVLLVVQRRAGLLATAAGAVFGLFAFAVAQWLTEGRFLLHVFLYNVNRYSVHELLLKLGQLASYSIVIVVMAAGAALQFARRRAQGLLIAQLREDRGARAFAMVLIQALICTAMIPLAGKSGASINYFAEWFCIGAVLGGVAIGEVVDRTRSARPDARQVALLAAMTAGAITLQVTLAPNPYRAANLVDANTRAAATEVIAMIHASDGEVIADDMVVLLRAGRRVFWEAAIFAELASMGRWDERLITEAIRDGRIGLALTIGERGDPAFDQRYTRAVADAMDAAWPRKQRLGWFTFHLPADEVGGGADAVQAPARP